MQTEWRSIGDVFVAFLKLGVTSFGGPIAHIGYFRRELIERRRWIDEAHFAQLVALCQFLPGPASSQLGFSLGLLRAGWLGGIAAFIAFTFPSVLLLLAFAHALPALQQDTGQAAIHGLKLMAVAVVAHGVISMTQKLTPDLTRRCIALASAALILIAGTATVQLLAIVGGAVLGLWLCRDVAMPSGIAFASRYSHRSAVILLCIFAVLLAATFIPSVGSTLAAAGAAFYRAGALVFGGGHVVLPLLQEAVVTPGWIDNDVFLSGYGAAQAVPGPMFSFAAFLGMQLDHGVIGALFCTLAIFLPGFLLVAGVLPGWHAIAQHPRAARALAGINAAVVGLLAAALYDPLFVTAVLNVWDLGIALIGFAMLLSQRVPLLMVLAWCVIAAVGSAALR
jgi:chromate transporter